MHRQHVVLTNVRWLRCSIIRILYLPLTSETIRRLQSQANDKGVAVKSDYPQMGSVLPKPPWG